MILFMHLRGHFDVPLSAFRPFQLYQGVTFFFILSGFILSLVHPTVGREGTPEFLLKRLARIWPAHLATFALVLVIFPRESWNSSGFGFSWLQVPANLALVQSWVLVPAYVFSFNAPAWSLSVEFAFYLLFPLLIKNFDCTWHIKLAAALGLVAIVVFCCSYLNVGWVSPNHEPTFGTVILANPLTNLFFFILGMTTCLMWRRYSEQIKIGIVTGTAVEVSTLGLVALSLYCCALPATFEGYTIGEPLLVWLLIAGGVSSLPLAGLIFVAALQSGLLARLLSFRVFIFLGEISYSVYLVHRIILIYYIDRDALPRVFAGILWLPYLAIVFLSSYLIWIIIERPARRWIIGFVTTREPQRWSRFKIVSVPAAVAALAVLTLGHR